MVNDTYPTIDNIMYFCRHKLNYQILQNDIFRDLRMLLSVVVISSRARGKVIIGIGGGGGCSII
jgi:hypothetical protein